MIECDMNQVEQVNRLLHSAPDRRDDKWKREFLSAVVNASFACANPQVFIGPDGFSYFGLYTPRPAQPFNAYCICNLIEPLTEQGIGISINPQSAGVDWVFTAGDLLTYRLYNTFDVPENGWAAGRHEEALAETEQVLIAAPSESHLPSYTRRVLRRFIEERLGVKNPGVFLMSRASGQPSQHLVFSIYPDHFAGEAAFNSAFNALTWFLPRHYSVIAVPKGADWERHFQAL